MKKLRLNRPKTLEFEAALIKAERDARAPQPLCRGRDAEYVGFDITPSKEEAQAMCEPCELLALCKVSARQQKPAWGVQGGIAWHFGRQAHWLKKPLDSVG